MKKLKKIYRIMRLDADEIIIEGDYGSDYDFSSKKMTHLTPVIEFEDDYDTMEDAEHDLLDILIENNNSSRNYCIIPFYVLVDE